MVTKIIEFSIYSIRDLFSIFGEIIFIRIYKIKKYENFNHYFLVVFRKLSEAHNAFLFFQKEKQWIKYIKVFLFKKGPKISTSNHIDTGVIQKPNFKIFISDKFLKNNQFFVIFSFFGSFPSKFISLMKGGDESNDAFFVFCKLFDLIYFIQTIEGESILSKKITIKNQEKFRFQSDFLEDFGESRRPNFQKFLKNMA